jgi:hypothetical protein
MITKSFVDVVVRDVLHIPVGTYSVEIGIQL